MADFEKVLPDIFRHEGGFVNDPDDRGGATNMGITQATLADWRGRPVTVTGIRELTVTEAGEIYREKYWDLMRLDQVVSQKIAGAAMDFGVNAGIKQGARTLQESVNIINGIDTPTLKVDGKIGPRTLAEINSIDAPLLALTYYKLRVDFYIGICRRNATQKKFLYAWVRRAVENA